MAGTGHYLDAVAGVVTQIAANTTSAGAGDSDKLVALNGSGQVDITMMPTGIGPDTATLVAKEAVAAGAFVNVVLDSGTLKVQNADNSAAGKQADGFVLTAQPTPGQSALVYFNGINNALSGLTPLGAKVYLGTVGASVTTPPSSSGNVVQYLGKILTATSIQFQPMDPITLA